MAVLTPTAFYNKWILLFPDNITAQISELDMRNFTLDMRDSIPTWSTDTIFAGFHTDLAALTTAVPDGTNSPIGILIKGVGTAGNVAFWDNDDGVWREISLGGSIGLDDLTDVSKGVPEASSASTIRIIGDPDSDGNYNVVDYTPPGATGEANTGSNQGILGVGVFDNKNLSDLEFRNLVPASNKISVALDAPNKEIDLDVVPGNINTSELNNDAGFTSGATNLAYTPSPTQGVVTSDTGTDATVPAADVTNAGLMLPADKTKLDSYPSNPVSIKGDLLVRNSTVLTRLGVGVDGLALKANSTVPTGMEWATIVNSLADLTNFGAIVIAAGNNAVIAKKIILSGDMTSLSFSNNVGTVVAILEFTCTAQRSMTFGAGHVFDESNNELTTITLEANQNITLLGWFDDTTWHWTIVSKPEGAGGGGLLNKDNATAAPAATDDSGDGYAVLSRWLDTTNKVMWFCQDATVSAAVWIIESQYGIQTLTDGATVTYDTNKGPKAQLTSPAGNRTINLTNLPAGISREGYLNVKNTNSVTLLFQKGGASTNVYIVNDGQGDTAQQTTTGASSRDSFAWIWDGTDLWITYLPNFTQT